jgi:hypothetical protein
MRRKQALLSETLPKPGRPRTGDTSVNALVAVLKSLLRTLEQFESNLPATRARKVDGRAQKQPSLIQAHSLVIKFCPHGGPLIFGSGSASHNTPRIKKRPPSEPWGRSWRWYVIRRQDSTK